MKHDAACPQVSQILHNDAFYEYASKKERESDTNTISGLKILGLWSPILKIADMVEKPFIYHDVYLYELCLLYIILIFRVLHSQVLNLCRREKGE